MTNSLATVSKAFKKDTDFLILSHSVTQIKTIPLFKKICRKKKSILKVGNCLPVKNQNL
jgi:hypothetical protein